MSRRSIQAARWRTSPREREVEFIKFFVLQHPKDPVDDALTDFLHAEGTGRGEVPLCPQCGSPIGMIPSMPPIRVEIETWGKQFGDLAIGAGNEVLVGERFRDASVSSGLIGFPSFMPAEIVKIIARRGRVPASVPNYFLAIPGRSRALVDDRASEIGYGERWKCEECRIGNIKRYKRVVLEPNTWSGEDVFVPRGLPGRILTSQRFKDFCDRNAFTNCLLIPAERHHVDHFPWERVS
jgi:hypothetical protein